MTRRQHGGVGFMRSISDTIFGSGNTTPVPNPSTDSLLPENRVIHEELVNVKNDIIKKLNHFDELKKTMSATLEDARKTQKELLQSKSRRNHLEALLEMSNSQQEEVSESNNDVKLIGDQHDEGHTLNVDSPESDTSVVNPMHEASDAQPATQVPMPENRDETPISESPSDTSPSDTTPSDTTPSDTSPSDTSPSDTSPSDSPDTPKPLGESDTVPSALNQPPSESSETSQESDSENLFEDRVPKPAQNAQNAQTQPTQTTQPMQQGGSRRQRRYGYRRRSLRR